MNYAHGILSEHRNRSHRGTIYRIVVRDELSKRFATAFEEMQVETRRGQTVLTGEIIDQPKLHSILDRIGALGLKLVSVETIPREGRTLAQTRTRKR